MTEVSVVAVLLQPAAVEFVAPALHGPGYRTATLVTNRSWIPPADRDALAGCDVVPADRPGAAVAALLAGGHTDLLVISATRHPAEADAVAVAAARGIRVIQILDAPYDHVGRARDSAPDGFLADAIAVVSERDRCDAITGGLPAERIVVVGHPGWERVRPAAPADPANMVFVSQPIRADGFGKFGYSETASWQMVLAARRRRPDLFSRLLWAPHPREPRIVAVPEGCDGIAGSTADALQTSGSALGIFSAAMTHAFLMGRRVISVQPGHPPHDFCGLSRSGWIPRCGMVDELIEALGKGGRVGAAGLLEDLRGSASRLAALIRACG